MEWYDRFFDVFATYGMPFLLVPVAVHWARRKPRTRATVFWAAFVAVLAVVGFVRLALVLIEGSG
jgi:type II secretory pathway component PulM